MLQFFISSTFEDMVGEREILHQEIIPKVNEYACKCQPLFYIVR